MNGMPMVNEPASKDVDFVRTALTTHVRQVHNFCMAGVSRLEDLRGNERIREGGKLQAVGHRLLNHAEQMVLATRIMPKPHGINAEQLEAEIHQARKALTRIGRVCVAA